MSRFTQDQIEEILSEDRELARWIALFEWQWETYVNKEVYVPKLDKVCEITHIDVEDDDEMTYLLEEKLPDGTYGDGEYFSSSEFNMLELDWDKVNKLLVARDKANNIEFKKLWNDKMIELLEA
jgi:hypothetical protein